MTLEGRGAILDTAREVSRLIREAGLPGVVVGGVAVVLHGHVRTTADVDVLIEPPLERLAALLRANGFLVHRKSKEITKGGVSVHLVLPEQAGSLKEAPVVIEGITTVTLADLIGMKLRSGSTNPLRAQDLADVIGLIRHHRLTGEFARRLDKQERPAFRKLARLIQREVAGR